MILMLSLTNAYAENTYALTISGNPVSFTEANIYIINAEKEYESVCKYYEDYLNIDYWSLTYANGMTVSQIIKADVFDQILSMNAFYLMAIENGMDVKTLSATPVGRTRKTPIRRCPSRMRRKSI